LDLLPHLTSIGGEGNTYTAVYVHLPHDTALLQLPDYVLPDSTAGQTEELPPADFAGTKFARDDRYHVNMASFLLLGKFIEFLKDEGVYDNTRIILVSDHGRGSGDYEKNIRLPDGSTLQSYNPLLMFKDFNVKDFSPGDDGRGETGGGETAGPAVDDSFMTNADTVFFALKNIIADPVNPFTKKRLEADKAGRVKITTIGALSSYRHSRYQYTIHRGQWMTVHSNIFDPANWEIPEK
jgi:hypothetical protein